MHNKLIIKLAYLLRLKNQNLITEEEYLRLKAYFRIKYTNEKGE
jgi:hypothetical protein